MAHSTIFALYIGDNNDDDDEDDGGGGGGGMFEQYPASWRSRLFWVGRRHHLCLFSRHFDWRVWLRQLSCNERKETSQLSIRLRCLLSVEFARTNCLCCWTTKWSVQRKLSVRNVIPFQISFESFLLSNPRRDRGGGGAAQAPQNEDILGILLSSRRFYGQRSL